VACHFPLTGASPVSVGAGPATDAPGPGGETA